MSAALTPGAAPARARILSRAAFETRMLLANGEQLLVSLILPSLALGGVLTMAVAIEGTPLSIELDLEGGGVALSPVALVDGVPGFDLGPAFFGAQLGLLFRVG